VRFVAHQHLAVSMYSILKARNSISVNKMCVFKKVWCRLFQTAFRIALPLLPYREPKIVAFCSALGDVFKQENAVSGLIVTDAGIIKMD
jgi:hypothetical protein